MELMPPQAKDIPIEEEHIIEAPRSKTLLGTESNLVCMINRSPPTNGTKYVCTSDKNQKIRFYVLSILDHCVDQIHIISGGRSGGTHNLAFFDDVLKVKTDDSKSLIYDPIYDIKSGEPFNVAFKKAQMNKRYTDSAKLKEFLNGVRNEIREYHSFQLLRDVIYQIKVKTCEAKGLLKQTDENYNKMKDLKHALATQGRDSRSELHKVNNIYSAVCESVQHLLLKNLIQLRYAKAYENSRWEQNKIKCERECREMQNIITKYKHKIDLEDRVHGEISRFLNYNQKDLRNDIRIWIEKYNLEMEDCHFQILQINERLEEMKKYRENLTVLFADHKNSIEDFKDYKEKKRIKDEEKQRLINAATKIQAWWRGNMYRHQLGPYNPNKSKKGKRRKTKKHK